MKTYKISHYSILFVYLQEFLHYAAISDILYLY